MNDAAPKPVLSYDQPDTRPWIVAGWYASAEDASEDIDLLEAYGVHLMLVEATAAHRRPDGPPVEEQFQLRVRPDQAGRATELLTLVPNDLATAEPAADDAGEEPVNIPGADSDDPYLVFSRFADARAMVDQAAVLGSGDIDVLLPRLVSRDSPEAANSVTSAARFMLRVRRSQIDDARRLLDRIEVDDDQPEDEPEITSQREANPMPDPNDRILSYGGHSPAATWETVRKFLNEFEARLAANELEANGVRWQLLNDDTKSVLSWYGAFISVRLQVPSDDLEKARAVLANHVAADAGMLEPAEVEDPEKPLEIADEDGVPTVWQTVAVFESARAMNEAAMVLESSHLGVLLPRLVPRGERPPGEGARFVLRVQADDVHRARALLVRDTEERDEDELRCPRCGSWTIHEDKHELTNLLLGFVGKRKPDQCECLKCHFKGERLEFGG